MGSCFGKHHVYAAMTSAPPPAAPSSDQSPRDPQVSQETEQEEFVAGMDPPPLRI